jgi:hypothetical protein
MTVFDRLKVSNKAYTLKEMGIFQRVSNRIQQNSKRLIGHTPVCADDTKE